MTCIKTGAHVWFANYGYTVVGDLYAVGDCIVLRWNTNSIIYSSAIEAYASHYIEYIFSDHLWFHRDDLGITVVSRECIGEFKDGASPKLVREETNQEKDEGAGTEFDPARFAGR